MLNNKGLRLLGEQFQGFGDIFEAAEVGHEIEYTEDGLPRWPTLAQDKGEIDHEESQVGRLSDGGLFDIHEVLQPPVLLGVTEGELDLEPQGIVVDDLCVRQVEITAEQNGVGASPGCAIGFDDEDDIKRLGKELMQSIELIDFGTKALLGGPLLAITGW